MKHKYRYIRDTLEIPGYSRDAEEITEVLLLTTAKPVINNTLVKDSSVKHKVSTIGGGIKATMVPISVVFQLLTYVSLMVNKSLSCVPICL